MEVLEGVFKMKKFEIRRCQHIEIIGEFIKEKCCGRKLVVRNF